MAKMGRPKIKASLRKTHGNFSISPVAKKVATQIKGSRSKFFNLLLENLDPDFFILYNKDPDYAAMLITKLKIGFAKDDLETKRA